jgi:hypothetical protein
MCGRWTLFTTSWPLEQVAYPDLCGHPFTFVACNRSEVQSSWGGRRCDAGKNVQDHRLSQSHPCGQWQRVHLAGHGSVGVSTRRDPRLLAAWKANRQCVHRSIQQQAPERVSERSLFLVPPRCLRKAGGLAVDTTARKDLTAQSATYPRLCQQSQPVTPAHRTRARPKTLGQSGPTMDSRAKANRLYL